MNNKNNGQASVAHDVQRIIHSHGIRVNGRYYWHSAMGQYIRQSVLARFTDSPNEIIVYLKPGKLLCHAYIVEDFSMEHQDLIQLKEDVYAALSQYLNSDCAIKIMNDLLKKHHEKLTDDELYALLPPKRMVSMHQTYSSGIDHSWGIFRNRLMRVTEERESTKQAETLASTSFHGE